MTLTNQERNEKFLASFPPFYAPWYTKDISPRIFLLCPCVDKKSNIGQANKEKHSRLFHTCQRKFWRKISPNKAVFPIITFKNKIPPKELINIHKFTWKFPPTKEQWKQHYYNEFWWGAKVCLIHGKDNYILHFSLFPKPTSFSCFDIKSAQKLIHSHSRKSFFSTRLRGQKKLWEDQEK